MKRIRFIEEIYSDKYRTLQQSIMWDVYLDKKSDGMESLFEKNRVNPNLTILLERRYLDKNFKVIKKEIIGESDEIK